MKSMARSYVYWPGIDNQIESFVRECNSCSLTAKTPIKTKLSSWTVPDHPWERIHIDYAGPIYNEYFLIVVDARTKWPEVQITTSITTKTTIANLSEIFCRFGMPHILVSDNKTQFTSDEFKQYCINNGIQHVLTPRYQLQSNCQAERFVDTLKRSLKK